MPDFQLQLAFDGRQHVPRETVKKLKPIFNAHNVKTPAKADDKVGKKHSPSLEQRPEQLQCRLSASGDECDCNRAAQNGSRKCVDTRKGAEKRTHDSELEVKKWRTSRPPPAALPLQHKRRSG